MPRLGLVLAGGASRRMHTAKQALLLDGSTLLQRSVDACLEVGDCSRVVVVAPERAREGWLRDDARVALALEDPPLGGPVAGMAAGLAALSVAADDEVLLLACDLPRVRELVRLLVAAPLEHDGQRLPLGPVDDEGWPQYLAARYPAATLQQVLDRAGTTRDLSVNRLMRPLAFRRLDLPAALLDDVDSPQQARAAGIDLP